MTCYVDVSHLSFACKYQVNLTRFIVLNRDKILVYILKAFGLGLVYSSIDAALITTSFETEPLVPCAKDCRHLLNEGIVTL